MKSKVFIYILLAFILVAFTREKKEAFSYPTYFPKPTYPFANNPVSTDKTELGRALFYDPILSQDSSISCADCHSPFNSFAHTDHDLSHGINDSIGTRNAPALFNLAWSKVFMWDGAINHLDMQALAPISHPAEMGSNINDVVYRLSQKKMYPKLFQKAFGDSIVTGEYVLKALSQFQLSLISSNSKYDSMMRKEAKFSTQESRGYVLFKTNCNNCHTEPLFSNQKLERNGLSIDMTLKDFGRMNSTQNKTDSLLFKVPSLRNLSYTFPYMHDGRFSKLRKILQHYNQTTVLKNKINLSSNDQADLISFLLTLNDVNFLFNSKHGFPKNLLLEKKD